MKNITPVHLACAMSISCMQVYEITPEDLKCPTGDCPGVYEVTPAELQCDVGASCPGVHAIANSGDLIVVGKRLPPELEAQMAGKVGDDEYAVVIGRAYFANLGGEGGGMPRVVGSTTAPDAYEPFDPNYDNPSIADVA